MKQTFHTLIVSANVRYWEDATVNGEQDEDGTLIPCRKGNAWRPIIDLATGIIRNWTDATADIHYKVCDAGEYWLGDEHGNKLAKWKDDYVPDDFLSVNEDGWGDYIIMNVDATGQIKGWVTPQIDIEQWEII